MKNLFVILLASLYLVACGGGDKDVELIPSEGKVLGMITNSVTGNIISGVSVKIGYIETSSGSDGTYLLEGIPPGTINISAEKVDFNNYTGSVSIIENEILTYNIELVETNTQQQISELIAYYPFGSFVFNGVIDEVKMYSKVLSTEEVNTIFLSSTNVTVVPVFLGTWEGSGIQNSNITWSIRIVISENEQTTIEYPSLNCGGSLTLISQSETIMYFEEKITFGQSACLDSGFVELSLITNNELDYKWYYSNSQLGAEGSVVKQ